MAYMDDVLIPEAQRALLERARGVHDPVAALTGRVTVSGVPSGRRSSRRAKAAAASDRTPDNGPLDGLPGRHPALAPDGSEAEGARSTVAYPSGDPRTPALTRLLCQLAPELRALVLEIAQDEDAAAATIVCYAARGGRIAHLRVTAGAAHAAGARTSREAAVPPADGLWLRLCDAMDLLRVTPAQVCAWVDDGTLRYADSSVGLWVWAEDVLAIERGRLVADAAGRVA